ncbi:MAG: hypothetical protein Q9190_004182 [Brigantiaea leucoxantha]
MSPLILQRSICCLPSRSPSLLRHPPRRFLRPVQVFSNPSFKFHSQRAYLILTLVFGSSAVYFLTASSSPRVPPPPDWILNWVPPRLLEDHPPPIATTLESSSPEDVIETGTTTIPEFPKIIWVPSLNPSSPDTTKTRTLPFGTTIPSSSSSTTNEEYTLLGLGVRKVSFLRIQVYVVGLYVSTSSLPLLQETLIRAFAASQQQSSPQSTNTPGGGVAATPTTLVETEKNALKSLLLSPNGSLSEELWSHVLQEPGLKTALRIVPTRNTDFSHMREGWVRSIQSRSDPARGTMMGQEGVGSGLEESVAAFKGIFGGGRKGVAKGKVLVMNKSEGQLRVWVEDEELAPKEEENTEKKKKQKQRTMRYLGGLEDERISRLVWLGYLAGGNVASEDARKSVVDGVMEVVGRPIGTVETRVV